MKNMIQPGNAIDFVNDGSAPIPGGGLVFFGPEDAPLVGVASTTVPVDGTGSARVEGVFRLPKATGAIDQGAPVHAAISTGQVSAGSGVYIGRAWESAGADAAEVAVRINFGTPPAADSSTE